MTRIADARHGEQVKLVGRVIALDDQAEAPLSQRDCVFVHAWMERIEVTSLINGLPVAASRYVDYANREVGVRGKEAVVCAGDRIAVVGTVTRSAPGGDGPFRAARGGAAAELVLSGSRAAPVVLADLEHPGRSGATSR